MSAQAGEGTARGAAPDPQQIALRAEELRGHLEMVSRQLEILSSHRDDSDQALATLRGLQATAPGDEALFPVGGNTFVAAQLGENREVIVGVGADYAMPRPVDKAIAALEEELSRLQDEIASLTTTAGRLEAEYSQLVQMLQTLRGQGGPEAR